MTDEERWQQRGWENHQVHAGRGEGPGLFSDAGPWALLPFAACTLPDGRCLSPEVPASGFSPGRWLCILPGPPADSQAQGQRYLTGTFPSGSAALCQQSRLTGAFLCRFSGIINFLRCTGLLNKMRPWCIECDFGYKALSDASKGVWETNPQPGLSRVQLPPG